MEVTSVMQAFQVIGQLFQGLLLIFLAPLCIGILSKIRARAQGRRGAALIQPYRNIRKNLSKESLVTDGTTWIFKIVPVLIFSIYASIALSIPFLIDNALVGSEGEILTIVFLLALARFLITTAALDTGTSFGGLGASREMSLTSLTEPATILSVFAIALVSGTTSLAGIVADISARSIFDLGAPHVLAFFALFIVLIMETGRIPVDNPTTHLELTMIHEAMVLEYSGWRLALIEWGVALKLAIYITLLISIFMPWGIATQVTLISVFLSLIWFLFKAALLLGMVGMLEAMLAKLRIFRVPDLIGTAMMLAILAVVTVYIGLG